MLKPLLAVPVAAITALLVAAIPAHASTISPYPIPLRSDTLVENLDAAQLYAEWQESWVIGSDCSGSTSGTGTGLNGALITEANNVLSLRTTGAVGSCAEIWSPGTYTTDSGVVEAEIKLPETSNGKIADWPAFWMDGPNWPTGGEIDAVEGPGTSFVTYHYGTPSQPEQVSTNPSIGGLTPVGPDIKPGQWVIVDIAFAPGEVQVYYNGVLYVTAKGSFVTNGPMNILFDITNGVAGVPATLEVSYLRVFS